MRANMAYRSLPKNTLTIPNLITLTRILLTPLFIIFLIQGRYHKALLIFALAGVSDLADGIIARTWKQKSRLGAYLDPLADKLLMSASFVTLSISHLIPSWLTVVVISRDVVLGLGSLILKLADYPLVIQPSLAGKWTTTLQLITVGLVLLEKLVPFPYGILMVFFYVTGALTIVSGIQYTLRGLRSVAHNGEQGEGGDG
jgi:cardiolipin synthase